MTPEHDPVRLLDDENEPAVLRDALRAGREELPDDDAVARIERRVIGAIAVGGGGGAGGGGGGGAAALSGFAVSGGVLGVGAVVALAVVLSLSGAPETAVTTTPDSGVSVAVVDAGRALDDAGGAFAARPGPPPSDETRPRDRHAAVPTERVETPPVEPTEDETALEVPAPTEAELVLRARRLLAAAPAEALAAAEQARELYPDGALAQEREMVAIQALLALGREDTARERADAFRARWPGSTHVRRLDVILP